MNVCCRLLIEINFHQLGGFVIGFFPAPFSDSELRRLRQHRTAAFDVNGFHRAVAADCNFQPHRAMQVHIAGEAGVLWCDFVQDFTVAADLLTLSVTVGKRQNEDRNQK